MTPVQALEALRQTARALNVGDTRESLRAVQTALDVLDGVRAGLLRDLKEQNLFELDGASSAKNWMRSQLRVPAAETSKLFRAADTLVRLPRVAAAIEAGQIRIEHADVFAYGLKHIGDDTITESMDVLLGVARTCEPGELFVVMKQLRHALYPEELDEQWAKGAGVSDGLCKRWVLN